MNVTPQPLSLNIIKSKRPSGKPDVSSLTDGQYQAMELYKKFHVSKKSNYFVLEGWAGTGKTYLTSIIIEWILYNSVASIQIAMTAPVHDAVKVLKASAEFTDGRLMYGTLHSLAGLKQNLNRKTGEITFKKNFNKLCKLDGCNYLIIDEGSMLDDFLFNTIHDNYVSKNKLKVIIIGDGGQIPPINHPFSQPFSKRGRAAYNMTFFELTEIVRQSKDNPIISFTTELRQNVTKANPYNLTTSQIANNKGVLVLSKSNTTSLKYLLKTLFTSKHFKKDPNYCKVICWRNSWVDAFNKAVRHIIFGKDLAQYMVGEKLIANSAILDGEKILATNRTRFEVLSSKKDKITVKDGYTYKCYFIQVITDDYGKKNKLVLRVIHEDEAKRLKDDVSKLFKLAQEEPDWSIKGKIFEAAHFLNNYFADVGYNYAITAHKCQGSTYQYAMVAMEDIYHGTQRIDVITRNKLGYTACTRPKDMLILLG